MLPINKSQANLKTNNMELRLIREIFNPKNTIGSLFVDGEDFCWTLEDVVRPAGEKVPGKTAIPYGRYEVVLNHSPKFGRIMPRLLNVPMFNGVLIHKGNDDTDTAGCVLVGYTLNDDLIEDSKDAFDDLFAILKKAPGKIFITITKTGETA